MKQTLYLIILLFSLYLLDKWLIYQGFPSIEGKQNKQQPFLTSENRTEKSL